MKNFAECLSRQLELLIRRLFGSPLKILLSIIVFCIALSIAIILLSERPHKSLFYQIGQSAQYIGSELEKGYKSAQKPDTAKAK